MRYGQAFRRVRARAEQQYVDVDASVLVSFACLSLFSAGFGLDVLYLLEHYAGRDLRDYLYHGVEESVVALESLRLSVVNTRALDHLAEPLVYGRDCSLQIVESVAYVASNS